MKKLVSIFLAAVLVLGSMGTIAFAAEDPNVAAYYPLCGGAGFADVLHPGNQLKPPSDGNAVVGEDYLSLHRDPKSGNPDNTGHLVSDYPGAKLTGRKVSFAFAAKVDNNQTRNVSAEEAAKRTIFLFGSKDYAKNSITLRYYYADGLSAVVLVNNGSDAVVASFPRPSADIWHSYAIALDGSAGGKLTVYVDGSKLAEADSKGIGADEIGSDTLRLNRATSSNTINVDACYRDLRFFNDTVTQAQAQKYTSELSPIMWKELQNQTVITDGMKVRSDLELPTALAVTWESSDPAAIDPATGKVNRPAYGEGEKPVTLTLCYAGSRKDYTVYLLPLDAGDSLSGELDFDGMENGVTVAKAEGIQLTGSMGGYGKAADLTGSQIELVPEKLTGLAGFTVSFDIKAPVGGSVLSVNGTDISVADNGSEIAVSAGGSVFTAASRPEWKKVTASFSDTKLRLYIDGEPVVDQDGGFGVSAALAAANTVKLGGGIVDNVMLYDRALSIGEINDYMAANVAPVMNVSGGDATNPVDTYEPISITHPAGNSVIYYTLDGSEPSLQSTRYSGEFHANGVARVRACAIASNGVKSAEVTAYVYSKPWAATAAEFRVEGENTVNNAKIGWPLYPGAEKYEIYRGGNLVGTATGDAFDEYNLGINKNYSYVVKAVSGGNVIAEASTNVITTFAINLDDVTGYDDNVNGKWVPTKTGDPKPSGYAINGKYYKVKTQGVSRDEFAAAGFDPTIWDNTCSVTSIRYMESEDGINWPADWTITYPIFVDMRLEGAQNGLHYDKETIVYTAHAEGTNGYGVAKLFFAAFKPGRSAAEVQPYGVTVAGNKLIPQDSPWEQYEEIQNPGKNQLSSYYIGRPFGYDSRDMVRFADGQKLYTFSATNMNQDMLILELDDNWTKPERVVNVILKGKHQESPSVFHDGNAYYVYTSTTNGWYTSQARYASAQKLDEPWSPLREIANSGTFGTQANGVWGYGSESGRVVQRGHGYNWGQSGGWRKNNYQRFFHMAINNGVATGAWCYHMEYHPYWGAIAVQSGELVSLGKKATAEGKDAPELTDNLQFQSSKVTDIQKLPYDIVVDLEKPTVVTEVNLTNAIYMGSTCGSYFKVYGSNDQNNWTEIADQTGDDYDDPSFRCAWVEDKTPYRYIKVTVTAVKNFQNGQSALWGGKPMEVAIYGKPEGYVDENYQFTDEILVGYDRHNIDFEPYGQAPVIVNSRTMVPLRAIFEAMGAEVNWDDAAKTVTASRDGVSISLAIGSDQLYVNGEAKTIDTPAQIINSRTMVPVRAIAESFGCEVNWNDDARRVYIEEAE